MAVAFVSRSLGLCGFRDAHEGFVTCVRELTENAVDACLGALGPASPGDAGTRARAAIRVEVTKERDLPGTHSASGASSPGQLLRIVVSDTGCGFRPETETALLARLFGTNKVAEGLGGISDVGADCSHPLSSGDGCNMASSATGQYGIGLKCALLWAGDTLRSQGLGQLAGLFVTTRSADSGVRSFIVREIVDEDGTMRHQVSRQLQVAQVPDPRCSAAAHPDVRSADASRPLPATTLACSAFTGTQMTMSIATSHDADLQFEDLLSYLERLQFLLRGPGVLLEVMLPVRLPSSPRGGALIVPLAVCHSGPSRTRGPGVEDIHAPKRRRLACGARVAPQPGSEPWLFLSGAAPPDGRAGAAAQLEAEPRSLLGGGAPPASCGRHRRQLVASARDSIEDLTFEVSAAVTVGAIPIDHLPTEGATQSVPLYVAQLANGVPLYRYGATSKSRAGGGLRPLDAVLASLPFWESLGLCATAASTTTQREGADARPRECPVVLHVHQRVEAGLQHPNSRFEAAFEIRQDARGQRGGANRRTGGRTSTHSRRAAAGGGAPSHGVLLDSGALELSRILSSLGPASPEIGSHFWAVRSITMTVHVRGSREAPVKFEDLRKSSVQLTEAQAELVCQLASACFDLLSSVGALPAKREERDRLLLEHCHLPEVAHCLVGIVSLLRDPALDDQLMRLQATVAPLLATRAPAWLAPLLETSAGGGATGCADSTE